MNRPVKLALVLHDLALTTRGRRRRLAELACLLDGEAAELVFEVYGLIAPPLEPDRAQYRVLEAWRDTLIADDDALEELLARWPEFEEDRSRLSSLIRSARLQLAGKWPDRRPYDSLLGQLSELQVSAYSDITPPAARAGHPSRSLDRARLLKSAGYRSR